MDLFTEHQPVPQADGDSRDLDTLDIRCTQFIARWGWKENLIAMRAELNALIDFAKAER